MAAVVTLGVHYDVRPGAEERFERAVADAVAALDGLRGHRGTRLYRDVWRPASYLVYSEWASVEDFAAFAHSATFARVRALGPELLLGPPLHRVYRHAEVANAE